MDKMFKYLLVLLIVAIANTYSNATENVELPPLPDQVVENIENTQENNLSFWQKVKNFFGFSEKKPKPTEENTKSIQLDSSNSEIIPIKKSNEQEDTGNPNQEADIIDTEKLALPDESNQQDNTNNNPNQGTDIVDAEKLALPDEFNQQDNTNNNPNQGTDIVDAEKLALTDEFKSLDNIDSENNNAEQQPTDDNIYQTDSYEEAGNTSTENIDNDIIDNNVEKITTATTSAVVENDDYSNNEEEPENIESDTTATSKEEQISDNPDQPEQDDQSHVHELVKNASNNDVPLYAQQESNEPVTTNNNTETAPKNTATSKSPIPLISKKEVKGKNSIEKTADKTFIDYTELSKDQIKFIQNETQMLLLPNDDVVLGQLTEKAKLDNMTMYEYINLFWHNYNNLKENPRRDIVTRFIKNYDKNFNQEKNILAKNNSQEAFLEASKSLKKGDIYHFIELVNNYPILSLSDSKNNNLLHQAAFLGNYPAAKILVIKGIDLYAQNIDGYNAMEIAQFFNHQDIAYLIRSAKGKIKRKK